MLTGVQIRAARQGLRLTVRDIANSANVSVSTIKRIEACDGIPQISVKNLMAVKVTLEAAGIEFIGTPDDGPGIRIRPPR
ncbi:transcriptional regulator [Parasphingorhabdus sp.]|uniref:helix-turn-helix domain-containing protein n=1 Tax=Parasphingorhabdus sp. TaxID=2709688 RepID=UPI003096B44D